jgi:hypothetical protein
MMPEELTESLEVVRSQRRCCLPTVDEGIHCHTHLAGLPVKKLAGADLPEPRGTDPIYLQPPTDGKRSPRG